MARVSSSAFSAGTCSATLAGSKSSIDLNFRLTAIWLPSSASVLSTLRFRPGVDAGHHVVEIIAVDLHELPLGERLQRLRGVAGEIAHHADDERQLAFDRGAFGLDLVGDVDARLADPRKLLVNAAAHAFLIEQG